MGHYDKYPVLERGVRCVSCDRTYVNTTHKPGDLCSCGDAFELYEDTIINKIPICNCGREARERYSLGIFAGLFCNECWSSSGFRNTGPEGFSSSDAGEEYESEPEII